jgi:YVTN family beta-propeller protein
VQADVDAHLGSGGSAHAVATGSVAGFISAANQTKLDGIAAGAEVNQNAFSQIMASGVPINAGSKTASVQFSAGLGISFGGSSGNKIYFSVEQNSDRRFVSDAQISSWSASRDKVESRTVDKLFSTANTGSTPTQYFKLCEVNLDNYDRGFAARLVAVGSFAEYDTMHSATIEIMCRRTSPSTIVVDAVGYQNATPFNFICYKVTGYLVEFYIQTGARKLETAIFVVSQSFSGGLLSVTWGTGALTTDPEGLTNIAFERLIDTSITAQTKKGPLSAYSLSAESSVTSQSVTADSVVTRVVDSQAYITSRIRAVPLLATAFRSTYIPELRTMALGSTHFDMAFDGEHMWLTSIAGKVYKVNAKTGVKVAELDFSEQQPAGVVFDGTHIWVSLFAINQVAKVNIITNQIDGGAATGSGPIGMAFDGTHIWVANSNGVSTLTKIHAATNLVEATVPVGNGCECVVFDGTHIWALNTNSNTVSKIDITTDAVVFTLPTAPGPFRAAFDGSHLWVGFSGGSTFITKIDVTITNGGQINLFGPVDVGVGFIGGVAFDGTNIYATFYNNNIVKQINRFTYDTRVVLSEITGARPIAFDGNSIWVGRAAASSIDTSVVRLSV